ncbi:MAG TPA: DUF485 domain-containing protein [Ruania sp.]|nr:DUF485 domain-containing protein [Ruania sp.]
MTDPQGKTSTASRAPTPTAAQYQRIQESDDFTQLRSNFRAFSIPMTVAFMVWYFSYVLMSAFATDVMSTPVVGSLNLGLVWGLGQFVTTFLITWLYVRRSRVKLDPLATKIYDELEGVATK